MTQRPQIETVDTLRLALGWVSGAYLANAALGTWLAIRGDLAGRPFGWDLHLTALSNFVFGLGTALSAPLVLLLALVAANLLIGRGEKTRRWAAGAIALLGIGFFFGMLAEPISWEVFDTGSFDLLPAAVVITNLLLPLAMVILAIRIRGRIHSTAPMRVEQTGRR